MQVNLSVALNMLNKAADTFSKTGYVKRVTSYTDTVLKRVDTLANSDVLVGIPKDKAPRRQGTVGNAELGYIHEFGSPVRNIPARPFLHPGVRNARTQVIPYFKQAAQQALEGDDAGAVRSLNRAGMIARNSVVSAITNPQPPFTPLKPATIRARLRRTAAGRRRLREVVSGGKAIGMNASDSLSAYAGANWATGGGNLNIQPLIDSGQLRAAITYVVRYVPHTGAQQKQQQAMRDPGLIWTGAAEAAAPAAETMGAGATVARAVVL
jgi:hypothetical protein